MKTAAFILTGLITLLFYGCKDEPMENYTNEMANDKMLLVLSAPFLHDPNYTDAFQSIVDFQIDYAKAIIGNDNVIVIADRQTMPYYKGKLPDDVLITDDVYDIWMRDFTTANPLHPVQFKYTWASTTQQESIEIQNSFKAFADKYKIQRVSSDFLLDGGNIVDNYSDKVITTTRFMEDNNLSKIEAKQQLMFLLAATKVAIVPPDEEELAHADGMVCWIEENTLLVNDYSEDTTFRNAVMAELELSFPNTTIIEVPVEFEKIAQAKGEPIESACGINLNATVTFNNIYVPVFGMSHDDDVLEIIKQNTTKKVITINAEGVCDLGGSVRCLTWQIAGKNAEKLILAAREN
jgi:agmatine/peptidylarginine deiminase